MGSPSRLPLQSSLPLDEDKIQDPVPLIPFSSSFAFAKTPYLRKPFLVVHIHLHNYSDRYTLLQEQAYRILTRIPPETTVTMKLATIYLSVIVFSGRAYSESLEIICSENVAHHMMRAPPSASEQDAGKDQERRNQSLEMRAVFKCPTSEREGCYSLEGSLFCFNSDTFDFRLPNGVIGNFRTGDLSFPDSFPKDRNASEHPASSLLVYLEVVEILKALGDIPDSTAVATTGVSSVSQPSIAKNASLQTTCTKTLTTAAASAVLQATLPINRTSNFTFSTSNARNSTPTATSNSILKANGAANLDSFWFPRFVTAAIAMIVGLGLFSLL
ncbi:hypothetical protein MMC31_006119 [Peltigera leucophlebia]|nr:hypothetical protein [Peltigera leucophlebia]